MTLVDAARVMARLLVFGAAFGCRSSSSRADAQVEALVEASPSGACVPSVVEKLGVPFLRVCPSQLTAGLDTAPFWISVVPIGCSGGEHDAVRCPPVIALAQPRSSDPAAFRGASSPVAAVIESDIAHKICTMRFAGRLPTRAERALSRSALGLSTVLVTESREVGAYRFQELSEWVTEMACDQPTILAPSCGVRGFPVDATPTIPWDLIRKCDPGPAAALDTRRSIGIDGECPVERARIDGGLMRDVPCTLQGPAADSRGRREAAVSLACGSAGPAPSRLRGLAPDVAAFRCVIEEWR